MVETREAAEHLPETGWKAFAVPGLVNGTGQGGASYAWFKREISVPAEWAGKRIFLRLGGARWDARVYEDGGFLAGRIEGYTPFEVELTKAVRPGAMHSLAVRCRDWSATFAPGYVLPPKTTGELRYFPAGQVLYPIGGHFTHFGLWDDVRLEARPAAFIADTAIVPSVRRGSLAASVWTDGALVGARVGVQVLDGSTAVLTPPEATLAREGTALLAAPFPGATPWSPERPHLYVLRLTLRDAGGAALDERDVVFGFRELWAEGPDFYLNGVKRHLLATSAWPSTQTQTREQVREIIGQVKAGHNVAMRLHTQPWREVWLEEADRAGLMIVDEGALWCDASSYAFKDPRFWAHYREHVAGMLRRDRNHAALVLWSMENELMHCGAGGNAPETEKRLGEIGRFAKAYDPGHLITFEADLDPDGSADAIGLHYPHELPDYADYPDTCDWLDQAVTTGTGGGLMGSRGAGFRWDRKKPLYIGEFLWVPWGGGAPGTVFFGDRAYENVNAWDLRAKAAAWEDQVLAYRRAGVSGLCPWTEFEGSVSRFPLDLNPDANLLYQAQTRAYAPLAAYLRERDTRCFAGDPIRRTIDVFNDTSEPQRVRLGWRLSRGGVRGGREGVSRPGACGR
ncbi:MAG: glycoside hydrolase family 2 TIM barrel-domain containing protein, partial [bacterium]